MSVTLNFACVHPVRIPDANVCYGWKADIADERLFRNEAAVQTGNKDPRFRFEPRWKEELVVRGGGGAFVLEHPMGVPSVYLPTEEEWLQRAPVWALDLWLALKEELEQWCRANDVRLHVDASADLYPA